MLTQYQAAATFVKDKMPFTPKIGIVLGTGLGGLTQYIDDAVSIGYEEIPHFPVSTVESHKGKLIIGKLNKVPVMVFQGRFHHYEGYNFQEVVFPIRLMKLCGVAKVVLSNAAGAVNLDYKKGTLMLVEDHINLQSGNPLIGQNIDELGPRFPDMSAPYCKAMAKAFKSNAQKLNITLNEGVYTSVNGPNLETRAEYRFLKVIGTDAVGMSTVPEVICARHMDMPTTVISVLTDECDPNHLEPVELSEIIRIASIAEKDLIQLLLQTLPEL